MLSTAAETLRAADRVTALDSHTANTSVLKNVFDRSTLNVTLPSKSCSPLSLLPSDWSRDAARWQAPVRTLDPESDSPKQEENRLGLAAIVPPLSLGTYSVQVADGSDETENAFVPLAATGRSLTDADPISVVHSPQTIVGSVSETVTDHYYRFDLGTTSTLNLSLSNLVADADLQLIQDANGNGIVDPDEVLAASYNPSTQSESIAAGLVAGTYFTHVYRYSGSTDYVLTAFTTPLTLPPGYNPADGYGLVDANADIASAIGHPLAIVPTTATNAWDLNLVHAPDAWANGYTGQGVVVAVIDTGVDSTHPDLKDNIWTNVREIPGNGIDDDGNGFIDDVHGWDFVDRDNTPTDLNGHGTHVAGTIAAAQNGFGITGVAYNATIMPVRVIGSDGGSAIDVAAGIHYAADNGASVINLSLGGGASSAIAEAVQYATQEGALVVMAAGNDGGSQPTAPANLANQWGLAVGAIDINDKLAPFSNRAGASPLNYVVAPGVNIISTTPNNTYQTYSGTSMAAPHVSGVAALILSANPTLTPTQLVSLLIRE